MGIDFSPARWERIRADWGAWWDGTLERPLVGVQLTGRDPGRPEPDVPPITQAHCHRFDIPAEAVIDRIDYDLSCQEFLGDAFPTVSLAYFGPGLLAAMLGARLDNASGRVWFHPPEGWGERELEEIHLALDPDSPWLRRILDLYRAANDRWGDGVVLGMPDLGGTLDVLQTFRPGEALLLDLYDDPEAVERLTWEIHAAWFEVYDRIRAVTGGVAPGYSDWGGLFCAEPHYMLQCDFCYMIGPEMFDRFVKPELATCCARLARSFYHLDGVGQLPHVESLLSIEALDGVQWVPGDGHGTCRDWIDLYRRIHEQGKRLQILYGDLADFRAVVDALGTTRGMQMKTFKAPMADREEILRHLEALGVPAGVELARP